MITKQITATAAVLGETAYTEKKIRAYKTESRNTDSLLLPKSFFSIILPP
jgi:hypothetical protein